MPSSLIRDYDSRAEKRADATRLGHVASASSGLSVLSKSQYFFLLICDTASDVNTILRSTEPVNPGVFF